MRRKGITDRTLMEILQIVHLSDLVEREGGSSVESFQHNQFSMGKKMKKFFWKFVTIIMS